MAGFLAGKVVAVTGGGGGIGRAVALAAADEGAKVLVADYGVGMAGEDPTQRGRRGRRRGDHQGRRRGDRRGGRHLEDGVR